MRTRPIIAGLLVVPLVMLGCSGDIPTDADAAVTPASPLFAHGAGNPVVVSVRGAGHFTSSAFPPMQPELEDGWRNFSFNANKRADESLTGQMQFRNRESEVIYHGDVICLEPIILEGLENTYAVATRDRRVRDPVIPTALGFAVWAVQDNGQGANDPPDALTFTAMFDNEDTAIFICEFAAVIFTREQILDLLIPIEAGNISVHIKY